jgi:hypothetical protein
MAWLPFVLVQRRCLLLLLRIAPTPSGSIRDGVIPVMPNSNKCVKLYSHGSWVALNHDRWWQAEWKLSAFNANNGPGCVYLWLNILFGTAHQSRVSEIEKFSLLLWTLKWLVEHHGGRCNVTQWVESQLTWRLPFPKASESFIDFNSSVDRM